MPLGQIHQIALSVRDVAAATRFYRETLGLPFLFEAPPQLAFFDCAGVRLMISQPEGTDAVANSPIYFHTPDIRAEFERLRAAGVFFEHEPTRIATLPDREVWLAPFRDPERNLLALMSEPRIP